MASLFLLLSPCLSPQTSIWKLKILFPAQQSIRKFFVFFSNLPLRKVMSSFNAICLFLVQTFTFN